MAEPEPRFAILRDPGTRTIAREIWRFAAVGTVATVVHYSILIALVELAHAPIIPATSMGFIFGATVSYGANRRITFRHRPQFTRGLLKFMAVGTIGLGLNALIVACLVRTGLPYLLAQVIATGIVLAWNFTVARVVVFKPQMSL